MMIAIRRAFFLSCCLLWLAVAAEATSETNELQQLKSQIDALIVQRQDDFSKLEAVARNLQNKDAEIDQLRNEIRDIKMELDSVKAKAPSEACSEENVGGTAATGTSSSSGCGNQKKNERLTFEWLSNSISEIRVEMAELAKSFNSTVALQQRQTISTDISILQNDVVSLRHDVEHLKTDATKYDAKLATLAQDVDTSKQSTSSVAAKLVNLTQQIRTFLTYDWSEVVKPLKKSQRLAIFKKMVVMNENPLEMQVFTTTRHRRRRDYSHKRNEVRRLRRRRRYQENDNNNSDKNHPDNEDDYAPREQDAGAVVHLEKRVKKLEKSLHDATFRNKGQEKLHSSMLELLESVENIEAKFDNVTPVLRKEISKLEFSLAQIIANLSLTRQHQENDKTFLSTVAENLSKAQSKLLDFESHLNINDKKLDQAVASFNSCTNFMLQNVTMAQQSSSYPYVLDNVAANGSVGVSSSSLSPLFQLFSIKNQYADFLRQLPKDCSHVNGGSGLYMISVDDGSPILVYCEKRTVKADSTAIATAQTSSSSKAYIVIQRRTTGEINFNRNWQEYAHGFGNLRGEFWLGNEIIHRLTSANDTGLRIEFEDAKGEQWFAEYDTFSVASRHQDYKLHVQGFSGTATNAFQHHDGMSFSTADSDHDTSNNTNCAADYESGWWYSRCHRANLNAKYNLGLTWFDSLNNQWIAITSTKMMLIKRTSTST
ncbi:protein scabrous-like [Planococcus citri]|uniref:protein scabrous-like n=1 Tax=Planococcus citri TaxID=170843 RepID=UPI0031F949D3